MLGIFKKKKREVLRKKPTPKRLTTLQFQIVVGVLLFIFVALIVTAIWYGTRISSLQIENIEVIGGQTISHELIKAKVAEELTGSYVRLIPKRFIPLYPKDRIQESIQKIVRIKNVKVERTENQTITIIFDEFIPHALWCEHRESENCLFIDATGFAFAQAPELEGSAFVRYVESGVMPVTNTNSFESIYIKETEAFVELLKETLSLYVTHVTKIGKYDIEYTISGGGVIKISQTIPMEQSFRNLETILHSKEFSDIEPGSFQYIDLRFGDKIFLNEEIAAPDVEATTSDELR